MALLTKKEITSLAKADGDHCLSIFIPTHRAGDSTIQEKDRITLKNQVQEATDKLEKRGLNPMEISAFLEPVNKLIEDAGFWNHQSDGLAIFRNNEDFHHYTLPINFNPLNVIGDSYHLKPLLPMLEHDGRFFILALELHDVHFYECTKYSIAEVYIDDLAPTRLEERVGFDYEQKSLQFRSHQSGQQGGRTKGQAVFHGQGAGEADRKDEIQRYFRAINDGLMNILHDESAIMVVAALDYLFAIYKEVNDYKHLYEKHVSGNPADLETLELHRKATDLLQPHFEEEKREKLSKYTDLLHTRKASHDIRDVVLSAYDGRIDTLFLQKATDIHGTVDPEKRTVSVHRDHEPGDRSLMNVGAIQTFMQGGMVYLLDEDSMPSKESEMNALYRY